MKKKCELILKIISINPYQNPPPYEKLVGDLQGQKVVASPIYKHHYNLETGECLEDNSVKVPAYDVIIQDEYVYIRA